MNDLQKTEFEMLKVFVDVCDKLNIKYYLVCGSALGAVKYNGFIPWDDDLDVGLLREDYEVFISKAQFYLPNHYFLQNYHTDKFTPFFMSKLRNCNTICVERYIRNLDINHGIYIDIFPLDGYPTNLFKAEKLEKEKLLHNKRRFIRARYGDFDFSKLHGVKSYIKWSFFTCFNWCGNTSQITAKFDKLASSYAVDTSNLICNHGNSMSKLEYAPKEQYGEGTWATFEGLKVRIPENYDAYLTQKYGDWRSDPPPEKQNSGHDFMIVDTTRPYTDYIEKLPRGRIRIKTKEEVEADSNNHG